MTAYEPLPGHIEIREFMETKATPNTSSSSIELPLAPPCSRSSSRNGDDTMTEINAEQTFKISTKSENIPMLGDFHCSKCPKSFHHWTSLHAHELVHSGRTPIRGDRLHKPVILQKKLKTFKNNIHSKYTITPVNTKVRRRLIHTSSARPGRVICDECGKFYGTKAKLRLHQMKRHSRDLHFLLYI